MVAGRGAIFFVALEKALRELAAGTETLNLGGRCRTPEDARRLADALKVNASLTTLYLYGNNIGDEGAASLADALKVNASLTTLDLGINDIGYDGAASLTDALKVNATLTQALIPEEEITATLLHLKISTKLASMQVASTRVDVSKVAFVIYGSVMRHCARCRASSPAAELEELRNLLAETKARVVPLLANPMCALDAMYARIQGFLGSHQDTNGFSAPTISTIDQTLVKTSVGVAVPDIATHIAPTIDTVPSTPPTVPSAASSSAASSSSDAVPRIDLDDLTLERKPFAKGGMAKMFRAEWHGEEVAVKVFEVADGAPREIPAEVLREVQAVMRANHPNVVRVIGIAEDWEDEIDPFVGIVMELVPMGGLHKHLGSGLSGGRATALLLDIARGLKHVHAQQVAHLDLKSANVLVKEKAPGEMKAVVTDFGLATTIRSSGSFSSRSAFAGTPPWMAPEQLRGERELYGAASDMYAFGVIAWELATGRQPWAELGGDVIALQKTVADKGERLEFPTAGLDDAWMPLI